MALYEAALTRRGVPFVSNRGRGYFQSDAVRDLVLLLRAIHDPQDRFALAAALTGPAFGLEDEDLWRLFGVGEGAPHERLAELARSDGEEARALGALLELREEAVTGSPARVVERALYDLRLLEVARLGPDGAQAAANLRKALGVARRIRTQGHRGLGDLLRHLSTLREEDFAEAEAALGHAHEDVVQLLTVHGAKGLEFPVVFLADAGRVPRGGLTPPFLLDATGRFALAVRDPLEDRRLQPAGYRALLAADHAAGEEEALRLLYVAATRAEERLVVSAPATGRKKDGTPKYLGGWAAALLDLLDVAFAPQDEVVHLDDAGFRVRVLDATGPPPADAPSLSEPEPTTADRARAESLVRAARADVAPLGETRFVVTVSELLLFAESPARYYEERVLAAARSAPARGPDDDAVTFDEDEGAAAWVERLAAFDEEDPADRDRARIGQACHAWIRDFVRRGIAPPEARLAAICAAVFDAEPPAGVLEDVRALCARFLESETARAVREAAASGEAAEAEVAFHARVRFPGGARVGPFDALLVKGSLDLWLPTPEGPRIVDHKTNRRGARHADEPSIAAHYAWQLRLYALAAERLLGRDVAGASLLLLDPSWGPGAVEVPIDVGGAALEETRLLCQALAVAERERRYPADWRVLVH
jgi:ATP-dependent exoDNAse (exonuclease V) beta subunit